MDVGLFQCPDCETALAQNQGKVVCCKCDCALGYLEEDLVVFEGCVDKAGFFDKQALERLGTPYDNYSYEQFKESIERSELYEMDVMNKKVGIARKRWWEAYLGKIENASVLEIGCGINYIVPYWLDSKNDITAFDICKESVNLVKLAIDRMGINKDHLNLFVADATKIDLKKKFDIININNVLHHIDDQRKVLRKAKEMLKENGKILMVEPNYYYPPRWAIETDFLNSINFIKKSFVKNDLIEVGEKAIVFSRLKKMIKEEGLKIEVNFKDRNYLGYFTTYFIDKKSFIPRLTYAFDQYFLSWLLPRLIAPFEYLILSK